MIEPASRFRQLRFFASGLAAILALGASGRSIAADQIAADQIAYAELNSEYLRIDISAGSSDELGPLSDTMIVGAFAGSNASHEYTVDAFDTFISIDTSTVETSLLGQLDTTEAPGGMAWDPVAKTLILITDDASCENATFYTLNVATAAIQSAGAELGCIKGLAIDSDENVFSIDVTADTLVKFGVAPIGALGFNFTSVQALFFDSTGLLDLIATEQNTGSPALYVVDTSSGIATLVAAGESSYSAFALAPDPDEIFKNGFQANAGFH
jgi:hypothetical protein